MNHRLIWLPFFGAVVAIAGRGSLLLRSNHALRQKVPESSPFTTTLVASGDVPIELEALGRVMALNAVMIRPQVGGQVTAIKFKDGQYVEQGDVLVEIDPRPPQGTHRPPSSWD